MTTTEASKVLLDRGIKVLKICKNKYSVNWLNGQPWENGYSFTRYSKDASNEWSGRDIIKLARSYTDSNQQTSMHKNVKKFSNDKDRTATRDAIQKEDFDKIPSKMRTKSDSLWNWD